jgi:hypothetical protein
VVAYDVEFTDEFGFWWTSLTEAEQLSVEEAVDVLGQIGPTLGRPQVDTLKGSSVANLKELRVTHAGRPLRVFFAFDPRRTAVLLIGGDKTGKKRFYDEMIPKAEAIYTQHLRELDESKAGGNDDGAKV